MIISLKYTNKHKANHISFTVRIELMKLLNGSELAGYIKERQAKAVRGLRQANGVAPKLAIIRTNPDPVVDSYMRLKQGYGEDILVDVEVHTIEQAEAVKTIKTLNQDKAIHGIIVQIPIPDPHGTTEILNTVSPDKDVDGLAAKTTFDAATPMAINWLLAGYNVDLRGKKIVIVGHGRLVGRPLAKLWSTSDLDVQIADKSIENLAEVTRAADVLITATGVPGLIKQDMVKPDAVIVDAGVATDSNGLVGDVSANVRELPNITITPEKGGVGPLTVCALFENVIQSARRAAEK
jgi:methylenetetrahydrofolate dehydrogenase (NADP+)/methenyltetrahydrofolate cyclohydrolase